MFPDGCLVGKERYPALQACCRKPFGTLNLFLSIPGPCSYFTFISANGTKLMCSLSTNQSANQRHSFICTFIS